VRSEPSVFMVEAQAGMVGDVVPDRREIDYVDGGSNQHNGECLPRGDRTHVRHGGEQKLTARASLSKARTPSRPSER